MKSFYRGLLVGILLKEKITEICSFLFINGINTIHVIKLLLFKNELNKICKTNIVIKITNETLFEETFHGKFQSGWKYFNDKKVLKIQPGWKYFNDKKVLKIEMEDNIINKEIKEIKISDLFELKDKDENIISLDIPFFETFGKVYIYFTYFVDSQKFINVYSSSMTISKNDFIPKIIENKNILCASLKYKDKTEYISNYLKLFYNNDVITPELILMNYDKLDIPIEETKLIIIKDKLIKEYAYNEVIE
jgi:hypothetical protein